MINFSFKLLCIALTAHIISFLLFGTAYSSPVSQSLLHNSIHYDYRVEEGNHIISRKCPSGRRYASNTRPGLPLIVRKMAVKGPKKNTRGSQAFDPRANLPHRVVDKNDGEYEDSDTAKAMSIDSDLGLTMMDLDSTRRESMVLESRPVWMEIDKGSHRKYRSARRPMDIDKKNVRVKPIRSSRGQQDQEVKSPGEAGAPLFTTTDKKDT
jgi:hypothetical protein